MEFFFFFRLGDLEDGGFEMWWFGWGKGFDVFLFRFGELDKGGLVGMCVWWCDGFEDFLLKFFGV